VKLTILCAAMLACTASAASAQTEGRLGVGGSLTINATPDQDSGTAITIGPLVRLVPRPGWRVSGAFNWFRVGLDDPAGGSDEFARLRTRPLMAGISYTMGHQPVLTTFSIVAGPSFNKAEFDTAFVSSGAAIDANNSFAVRPGASVTWTVAPRVALVAFGGYIVNRPDVTYRDRTGSEFTGRWNADAVVVSVGAVYSIF
jgi:hypothetical protein